MKFSILLLRLSWPQTYIKQRLYAGGVLGRLGLRSASRVAALGVVRTIVVVEDLLG